MCLPTYVRQAVGDIALSGGRLLVSDDPKSVIGDVLHMAVTGTDHSVDELIAELRPGGQEYNSGAGHMLLWLEDEDDAPREFTPALSQDQLEHHEVWLVVADTWGQGSEHAVVIGDVLRGLVERAGKVLQRS